MTTPRYVVIRYDDDVAEKIFDLASAKDYEGLMQYPHAIVNRKGLYEFADGGIDNLLPYNGRLIVDTRVRYQRIDGMNVREALWATGKFDPPQYSLCFRIEDAPDEIQMDKGIAPARGLELRFREANETHSLYDILRSALRNIYPNKAPDITPIEIDMDRIIESFTKWRERPK